ncbi:GAF and ANTAR domain-containing protein [Nocardioides lijunqiniae]|uniref:GAF and ANTAR domain-containing protein n=1 Tax=Nocardioides lijunqiniae TaxID=2760832 RepID=UPI001877D526|nr:GAF and ANTAR domain-containing protein [Nocardioides lijunqiniae]
MISLPDLSEFFVDVADTLVDDFDLVDFLDHLTEKAATVSGAAAVGLVLSDHQGRVRFMAASNESGKMLELLQIQNEEGPCLEALSTGVPVVNADLAHAADRWPRFAPRALEAGFQSVHAFPMRLRSQVIGALNIFGTQDARFEPDEVRVVQALADVATIAIIQERNLVQAELLTEQLQGALNSRIVIEQAKGALAQGDGITTGEAFDLLRTRARQERRRLVDVASEVLSDLERAHS